MSHLPESPGEEERSHDSNLRTWAQSLGAPQCAMQWTGEPGGVWSPHTYRRAGETRPCRVITSNLPKFSFIKIAQGPGRQFLPGSAPREEVLHDTPILIPHHCLHL